MTEETVREVHTSEGTKVTVKSKRGTGTRDQDEITVEASMTDPEQVKRVRDEAVYNAIQGMYDLRYGREEDGEDDE